MPNGLILNVSDAESARRARTRILQDAGFRVQEAESSRTALQLIESQRPSLVLLSADFLDGPTLEVCRSIKANPDTAAIPVLQIAPPVQNGRSRVVALEAGADAFLAEPVDAELLVATAKALLRMRALHEALQAEVERRRAAEEGLRTGNRRLQLLSDVFSGLLSSDAPPEQFLAQTFQRLTEELNLDIYIHYEITEDGETLALKTYQGVPSEFAQEFPSIGVRSTRARLSAAQRWLGVTAFASHVLRANGRVLGTLCFGSRSRASFEPDEQELLRALSNQVALALERRRYRADLLFQASLLQQVRNAVIATDSQGRIIYWNRAAEEIYQWKAAEAIGKNILEVTVPTEATDVSSRILSEVAASGAWEGEFLVRRKDGTIFPALVTDAALRSADGSVIGYVGVSVDITEQKRAAETLRESEEKYRRIVETAREGLWMLDPQGRTTFANAQTAALLGIGVAELQKRSIWDFVFEDDMEPTRIRIERQRHRLRDEFETRLRRVDDTPVWTRISASPMHGADGEFLGVLAMLTDITERKRAEEAAQANERKLRRLADSNVIGVITANPERILEANQIFLEMVGYTREELEAGAVRWRDMTPPEYAELDRRGFEELLATGTCQPFEKEYYRKDGERIPVLLGAALVNDKPEWLCFAVDLTERKKAEEALREVQKFESLGFLAAGVAHNLNNMLVGIMGNVSVVLESAQLTPEDRHLLDDAIKNSERAANLTSHLLSYAGKGGFLIRQLHLSKVVEELRPLFLSSISRGIRLLLNLADALPPIEADEGQLRQVVTNLVINAAESIGEVDGTIAITTRVFTFHVSGIKPLAVGELSRGDYVLVEVADTGGGIGEEILDKIFDPFFTTKFTGRGLGLAAVAGIVRRHKGAISVTTSVGKGTTFRVYLPVTMAP